jgi:Flp pilus assembly protein TadB
MGFILGLFITWVIWSIAKAFFLGDIEHKQDDTNRLLREQIRQLQLTPAQREKEEQQREKEEQQRVQRALEDKAEKERDWRFTKTVLLILGAVLGPVLVWSVLSRATPGDFLAIGLCLAVVAVIWWSVRHALHIRSINDLKAKLAREDKPKP